MLRIFKPFFGTAQLTIRPAQFMSIMNRITKSRQEKAEGEIKKEIIALANKPTFTLLDFKQRIGDQLAKLKNKIATRSVDQVKQQAKLEKTKKILNGLFDEQLNGQVSLSGKKKEEIALVVEQSVDTINDSLRQFRHYQKIHAYLRMLKEDGQPLPQTMEELSADYMQSGIEFKDRKKNRKIRYQKISRRKRIQYMKFNQ